MQVGTNQDYHRPNFQTNSLIIAQNITHNVCFGAYLHLTFSNFATQPNWLKLCNFSSLQVPYNSQGSVSWRNQVYFFRSPFKFKVILGYGLAKKKHTGRVVLPKKFSALRSLGPDKQGMSRAHYISNPHEFNYISP